MSIATVMKKKATRRVRRKHHIRKRIFGLADRPRLSVYRSLSQIYVQLIDDESGRTIFAASSLEKDLPAPAENSGKRGISEVVGRRMAERAKAAGITKVVFDRNGFRYHGRVKALAEGARAGGLEF